MIVFFLSLFSSAAFLGCVYVYICRLGGILIRLTLTDGWDQPTLEVTEADFDKCFDVNVKSVYFGTAAIIRQLLEQKSGGSIINIASVGATRPRPGLVWYNSSKGAVWNVRTPPPLCYHIFFFPAVLLMLLPTDRLLRTIFSRRQRVSRLSLVLTAYVLIPYVHFSVAQGCK